MRRARSVLAMAMLALLLAGCAGVSSRSRTVQHIYPDSLDDLPEAVSKLYQVTNMDRIHAVEVTRHGEETTSESLNYLVGMLPVMTEGHKIATFTAQTHPRLRLSVYNHKSNCTNLPKQVVSTLGNAARTALARAGNPMPPGLVEVHLVTPITRMYTLTTIRVPEPRIHLVYYFKCTTGNSDNPAFIEFYLGRAVAITLHELTHAAYQWRGLGTGSEIIADGAAACFTRNLEGFAPLATKRLSAYWKGSARLSAARMGGKQAGAAYQPDLQAICADWTDAMQQFAPRR